MNDPTEIKCRSCGARMYWTTTEPNRKRMPIDIGPSSDGKFIVNKRGGQLIAVHISNVAPEALYGRKKYHSHFQTCPNAVLRGRPNRSSAGRR